MFCHKCGNQVEDGSNFCPKCGASLEAKEIVVADQVPKKLRNLWAAWTTRACYLGIFSLLFSIYFICLDQEFPFFLFYLLSVIAAIAAVVTGVVGLCYAKKHPESKGIISSCIGIIIGTIFVIITVIITIVVVLSIKETSEELDNLKESLESLEKITEGYEKDYGNF